MKTKVMRAARLHKIGMPFTVDSVPIGEPRPNDVLVQVKACGIVPNLRNVVEHYAEWFPFLPLPKFPAIYGLDAAGIVTEVGSQVIDVHPGDRVYVNPGRSCGSCQACRCGDPINCPAFTFQGYFGFGPGSQKIFEDYPYAGFAEYLTAPANGLVKLPASVSFEQGARFGYLGTAYSALRKADMRAGLTVIINGISGTLGLGAVLLALAMGATRIFGTGRNRELLNKVKALSPHRIDVMATGDLPIAQWVNERTGGLGADIAIDALGPGAPASTSLEAIQALRRGGRFVDIGGMAEPLPLQMFQLMCYQVKVIGSLWFSVAEGEDMAELARAGLLDLSVLEHERFALDQVNEALNAVDRRTGGFTNIVVMP